MQDSINCFAWPFLYRPAAGGNCGTDTFFIKIKTAESLIRFPPDNQYVCVYLLFYILFLY